MCVAWPATFGLTHCALRRHPCTHGTHGTHALMSLSAVGVASHFWLDTLWAEATPLHTWYTCTHAALSRRRV